MRWLRSSVTSAIVAASSIVGVSAAVRAAAPSVLSTTTTSKFIGATPTRILDTRPDFRLNYLGDKPVAGSQTVVTVVGRASVPADATAVTGNLTVTEATGPGFVQAFPTGKQALGSSSNLNVEQAGQTIANAVTVPIGLNGAITLYSQSGTHLVLDITGFFVPVTEPTSAGRYVQVSPTRILDTRPATRLNYVGDEMPDAHSSVVVQVTGRGPVPAVYSTLPRVPLGVRSLVLNVTATNAAAPGYVQIAPGRQLFQGTSSSLNVERVGQTIANQVIVPVLDAFPGIGFETIFPGSIEIYTQGGADLVVDVLGYFTGEAATPTMEGLFVPVQPTRILDTRPCCATGYRGDTPLAGARITVDTADRGGVPAVGVAAVAANITITEATNPGFVQAAAAGTLVPGASSIVNASSVGQTIPNAAFIPTNSNGQFDLFTQSGGHLIADVAGYFTS
jgi:hypothetical protein